MTYELAVQTLYQGPPRALWQLLPEWVVTPFEHEEEFIAEKLTEDMWLSRHADVARRWLETTLASFGGTAGLRAAWIAWSGAYDVARSVLPRVEMIPGGQAVNIRAPLDHAVGRYPREEETIPLMPLVIELLEGALRDPMASEDAWDRLAILLPRAQRGNEWFGDVSWLRDHVIDAALWQALTSLEASVPAALESIEMNRRIGQLQSDPRQGRPVARLYNSIDWSITAIGLTYAGVPFRYLPEGWDDYPVTIPIERQWLGVVLLARWWHEVQRRLPIRGATWPWGAPDIVE